MLVKYKGGIVPLTFLQNDTNIIIKQKLFALDKFFYPNFIRLFYINNNVKKYLQLKNETTIDNDYEGDLEVEFIGDTIDSSQLNVFRIDPDSVIKELSIVWTETDEKELNFILNKIINPEFNDEFVENIILSKYLSVLKIVSSYNTDLKNIPKAEDIISSVKTDYIKYKLDLKDSKRFKESIMKKFQLGDPDMRVIVYRNYKNVNVKTNELEAKKLLSSKDFLDKRVIVFIFKNSEDKYIFNVNDYKLYVHSDDKNFKLHESLKNEVVKINVIDTVVSGVINKVFNVKKIPQIIKDHYTTFFKQKEFVRKGNSILLEYTRCFHEDIKVNIKNSKDGVNTKFVIHNMKTLKHTNYILDILSSLIYKTISSKNILRNFFTGEEEKIITEKVKTGIKKLKSKGVSVNSKKCQKDRQPEIDNDRKKEAYKYDVVYKNDRFLCNKSPFLFPGFTSDENVCCFKIDQRKKSLYNTLLGQGGNNTKVQASNLIIDGKRIIKNSNEDTYFHIKKVNPLEIEYIQDQDTIREIKKHKDIWLKETSLNSLLLPERKTCKKLPKNINGELKCKPTMFFGYTDSSTPCCFQSQPVLKSEIKEKDDFYNDDYIISWDKQLEKNRLGLVSPDVYYLFSNEQPDTNNRVKNKYFRLGTRLGLLDLIKNVTKTNFDVKDVVSKEIFQTSRNTSFESLKSLEEYIKSGKLDYVKIIDFISLFLKINIIIIDLESDDVFGHYNIYSINKHSVIFVKPNNGEYYEIICKIQEDKSLKKIFNTKDGIVANIKKYMKFRYTQESDRLSLNDIVKKLKRNGIKIKRQFISKNSKKVLFVETEDDVILPVSPSKGVKKNIKVENINTDIKVNKTHFDLFLKKYSRYYKNIDFIDGGVLLNKHLVLPTSSNFSDNINITDIVYKKEMLDEESPNKREELYKKIENVKDYYHYLKYNLSILITEEIKNDIVNIKNKKEYNRETKFNKIKNIIENISNFKNNDSYYLTQQLIGPDANDILAQTIPKIKIKLTKINFKNYKQFINFIKL